MSNIVVLLVVLLLWTTQALCQHAMHIEMVRDAHGAAYAMKPSGCPRAKENVAGWDASLLLECEYESQGLKGFVYLLDIKPEVIARWIESSCGKRAKQKVERKEIKSEEKDRYAIDCFRIILESARFNSGMMFPVSGNIIEKLREENEPANYFFRNGMTVSLRCRGNCRQPFIENGVDAITKKVLEKPSIEEQKRRAKLPNSEIYSISKEGPTRLWRCRPAQFARENRSSGAPIQVTRKKGASDTDAPTDKDRQKWLEIAKTETLRALESKENRLLDCWMAAHYQTIDILIAKKKFEPSDVPLDDDP